MSLNHGRKVLADGIRSQLAGQRRSVSAFGYTQAKALVFPRTDPSPADVLRLHSHPISPAHGDSMTLRFLASPINPSDVNQIQGVYPSPAVFTDALGTGNERVAVPGNEGVAEVVAVGGAVTAVRKGDWVLMRRPAFGTWRTHAVATEADVIPIRGDLRAGLDPVDLSFVTVNLSTAYRLLTDFWPATVAAAAATSPTATTAAAESAAAAAAAAAPIPPESRPGHGAWFVQNAANSGVGRAAIQLGRAWGMRSVNVIRARPGDAAATEALRQELVALGGDVVITDAEAADKDFTRALVAGRLGGKRARLALNTVGGGAVLPLTGLLDQGSAVVTYGAMSKRPFPVPAGPLIFKDIAFRGFWMTRWNKENPEARQLMIEDLLAHMRPRGTAGGAVMPPLLKAADSGAAVNRIVWGRDVTLDELVKPVVDTLEGFKSGKSVFVFEE